RERWPPPGTECCVVVGRPALRSVHRECNCCVIEPREHNRWERPPYANADAALTRAVWPEREGPAGVKERSGLHTRGSPGTWEILRPRRRFGRAADDRVQVYARRARVHRSEQERDDGNQRVKETKRVE